MKVAQYEVLGSLFQAAPVPDDRWLLAILGHRETRSRVFRSSQAGRTPLFASFPSTSYWATFTKSLPPPLKLRRTSRDESSAHTPKPYVDAPGAAAGQPPGQPFRHYIHYLPFVLDPKSDGLPGSVARAIYSDPLGPGMLRIRVIESICQSQLGMPVC